LDRFASPREKSVCSRLRSGVWSDNTICQFAGILMGATGLEPATSGVTGRVGHCDAQRRAARNGVICRAFSVSCRLRFAWLSQSSNRRLGHEWATKSCLEGQRRPPLGSINAPSLWQKSLVRSRSASLACPDSGCDPPREGGFQFGLRDPGWSLVASVVSSCGLTTTTDGAFPDA
jgi:hypothetical protein